MITSFVSEMAFLWIRQLHMVTDGSGRQRTLNCQTHRVPTYPWYFPSAPPRPVSNFLSLNLIHNISPSSFDSPDSSISPASRDLPDSTTQPQQKQQQQQRHQQLQ